MFQYVIGKRVKNTRFPYIFILTRILDFRNTGYEYNEIRAKELRKMIENVQRKVFLNPQKLKKTISFCKLAQFMGTNSSTLYSWEKRVPEWRTPVLEEFCKKTGVDISDCYEAEQ